MFKKYAWWLLSILVLLALSARAQRPATRKTAIQAPRLATRKTAGRTAVQQPVASKTAVRRPTTSVKPSKPVVAPLVKALVISVSDTSNGRFVVPQVALPDTAVAVRINLGLADAALGEDLETLPYPLTARAAIQQAHVELEANGQSGFTDSRYEVLYNDHNLLSVEFTSDFKAPYPFLVKRHATFDLRTGRLLEVRDLLADTLALRQRWQDSISRRVAEYLRALPARHPEASAELLAEVQQRLHWNDSTNTVQLEADDPRLYDFALTPAGLMLYYDFGFPHTMQVLQPSPDYLFSFAELKIWLKPKGLLGFRL